MKKKTKWIASILLGGAILTGITTTLALNSKTIVKTTENKNEKNGNNELNKREKSISKKNDKDIDTKIKEEIRLNSKEKNLIILNEFFIKDLKNNFNDQILILSNVKKNISRFFETKNIEQKIDVLEKIVKKVEKYTLELKDFENIDNLITVTQLKKYKEIKDEIKKFVIELLDTINSELISKNKKNYIILDVKPRRLRNIKDEVSNSSNTNKTISVTKPSVSLSNVELNSEKINNSPEYFESKIPEIKNILEINNADLKNIEPETKNIEDIEKKHNLLINEIIFKIGKEYSNFLKGIDEYIKTLEYNEQNLEKNVNFLRHYPVNYTDNYGKLEVINFSNSKNNESVFDIKLQKKTDLRALKVDFTSNQIEKIAIYSSENNENFEEVYSNDKIDKKLLIIKLEQTIQNVKYLRIKVLSKIKNYNIFNINNLLISNQESDFDSTNELENSVNEFWDKTQNLYNFIKTESQSKTPQFSSENKNISEVIEEKIKNIQHINNLIMETKNSEKSIHVHDYNNQIKLLKVSIDSLNEIINRDTNTLNDNSKNIEKLKKSIVTLEKEIALKDKELLILMENNEVNIKLLNEKITNFKDTNNNLIELKQIIKNSESKLIDLNKLLTLKEKELMSWKDKFDETKKEKTKLESKITKLEDTLDKNNKKNLNKIIPTYKVIEKISTYTPSDFITWKTMKTSSEIMSIPGRDGRLSVYYVDENTNKTNKITINLQNVIYLRRDVPTTPEKPITYDLTRVDNYITGKSIYGERETEDVEYHETISLGIKERFFEIKQGKLYLSTVLGNKNSESSPNGWYGTSSKKITIDPKIVILGYNYD